MASRFVLLLVLSIVVLCTAYRGPLTRMRRYSSFNGITMMSETETIKPGNPLVKKIDESKKIAYMTIALSGEQTQKAFNTACDMFNEVCYK